MSYECKTGLDLNCDFLNWRYIFLDIRGTTAGGYFKFLSLDFALNDAIFYATALISQLTHKTSIVCPCV